MILRVLTMSMHHAQTTVAAAVIVACGLTLSVEP